MIGLDLTGEVLIWILVDGSGTLAAPFVATVVLYILEAFLGSICAHGCLILLGHLFIAFVFLVPEGLVGVLDEMRDS